MELQMTFSMKVHNVSIGRPQSEHCQRCLDPRSSAGSPFVGDYRRASVIYDVACVERKHSDVAVHLRFYNAMRADGVPTGVHRFECCICKILETMPKKTKADSILPPPTFISIRLSISLDQLRRFCHPLECSLRTTDSGRSCAGATGHDAMSVSQTDAGFVQVGAVKAS